MKKNLSLILALIIFLASLSSCASVVKPSGGESESESGLVGLFDINADLAEQTLNLYKENSTEEITLAFFEGVDDVPMISLSLAVEILTSHIRAAQDEEYLLDLSVDGDIATLTRSSGAYCEIDLGRGTLFFNDYNAFNAFSYDLGSLDIMEGDGYNEFSEPEYLKRVLYSEKAGVESFVDLHERGIPTALRGEEAYLTLQTFSDIFLTPHEVMMAYNGEDCIFSGFMLSDELKEEYYGGGNGERSEELIDITYRQLCLLVDFHYGLKAQHGITLADAYFEQTGLKDGLTSEDISVFFTALKTFAYYYLADNHTAVLLHSPYDEAPDYSLGADEASIGYWEFYQKYVNYSSLRGEQVENGLTPYSEVGNTAFVVFDTFSSATVDYYENSPLDGEFNDEIGLISYAHSMINREDSPIENVVIDLSTNTGGHMNGGIFLASWVLGNALVHISDPIRSAEGTYMYRADVNLDRKFDEKDTISDKNVFLITSPISFSCANYIATAFKESEKVTILGATSGGGACCVYAAPLANGAVMTLSSSLCMSTYKNGTYYVVDDGISPDVKITDLGILFDYEKLAQLINELP